MIDYMKQHEVYLQEALAGNPSVEELWELLAFHDKKIAWMQHERVVHLLVMLFVCLFALFSVGYALVNPSGLCFLLAGLLVTLAVAYLFHYYRLENGVQKWYRLSDDIWKRIQRQ
jgi:hypothetical protein